jgi:Mg/Co/Ni transporter MgtE
MACSPVLISDKATITEVAEIFLNVDHHVLPVLDDQDDLLGLVSTNDIIKYFLKQ